MTSDNTGPDSLAGILTRLDTDMESIQFSDVISVIDDNYDYTPTGFSNGLGEDRSVNEAGSNEGSCKIFSFVLSAHILSIAPKDSMPISARGRK